jgi:nitrogen fixation-related uncharacterized protein|tara:strand:- start:630 stop:782 length:153 start_codon:yes stop_codon:yes gene_type:complete
LLTFFWTLKNIQYEDLKDAPERILIDEDDQAQIEIQKKINLSIRTIRFHW